MNKKTFRKVGFRLIHGCFLLCLANLFAVPVAAQDNHNLAKKHYFPQFADGKFNDGTYYKSKLMVTPGQLSLGSTPITITCTLTLYGMRATLVSSGDTPGFLNSQRINIAIPAGGVFTGDTEGKQSFVSGYAKLECSDKVFARVLYSFYSATGAKLSEATVFSAVMVQDTKELILDHTESGRLAIAIANPYPFESLRVTIILKDSSGVAVSTGTLTIAAEVNTAKFVDEIMSVPIESGYLMMYAKKEGLGNMQGLFSEDGDFSVIGLRFTGTVFTTIPATCTYLSGSEIKACYN